MKKIPITVYIIERQRSSGVGWYVTHDEAEGTSFGHDELGKAVATAVTDLFQRRAMKAMGQ